MSFKEEQHLSVSDWLDKKEAAGVDVSQIELPENMAFDEDPDEMIYFKEARPCSFLCTENHPFSKVERFGHWYYCQGQEKKAGIHSAKMKWRLFTKIRSMLSTLRKRI